MDPRDCRPLSEAYRLLAEVVGREPSGPRHEEHLSFVLGDLTRRIFTGTQVMPPEEVLELAAQTLRYGDAAARQQAAERLQVHADLLEQWNQEWEAKQRVDPPPSE